MLGGVCASKLMAIFHGHQRWETDASVAHFGMCFARFGIFRM
jgi:hypothetical protein